MSESRPTTYHGSSAVVAMPPTRAMMPSPDDIRSMLALGEQFVASGLMPDAVKTAAAVVVILQKGRELGIPPMQAINGIHVIKGKPTCSSDLMMALIYRDHGDNALRWTETTNESVTLAYQRRGWSEPSRFTWTKADTERAQIRNENNGKYPGAMLRARCVSAVARMAFNDTIGGMYLPSEIDASYDDDGVRRFTQERAVDDAAIEVTEATGDPETIASVFADADRKRASDALHAAARSVGMNHADIRRFMADRKNKPEAELSSMTTWDVRQFRAAKLQVDRFGREWVREQGGTIDAEATVTDADADPELTGLDHGVRRNLRPGESIDPDTGEIVPPAEDAFPTTPRGLLTADDERAEQTSPDDWTH